MLESKVLRLVLPVPPSVNHMYLHSRFGGKRIRTTKAKEWFDTAEKIVRSEIVKQGWEPTIEKKVVLDVLTMFPDRRKRDTNNTAKALCDMLEHAGTYDNDRFALVRYIDYGVDKENPRIEVVIRVFNEEGDGWQW